MRNLRFNLVVLILIDQFQTVVDKRGTSERRNKKKKTKINPKEEKANTNEEEEERK